LLRGAYFSRFYPAPHEDTRGPGQWLENTQARPFSPFFGANAADLDDALQNKFDAVRLMV